MNKLKAARLFGRPFKLNPLGLPVSAMIVPVLVIYQGGCLSRTLYRYAALNIGFQ